MSNIYLPEQREYIIKKVKEEFLHPRAFFEEFNEKFGTNKTCEAITAQCKRMGIDYKNNINNVSEAEKIDLERLKNTVKEYEKEKSLEDRLVEVAGTRIYKFKPVPFKRVSTVGKGSKVKESLGMLLSDFHIGETVSKEAMGGFAEYNFDIFKNRYNYYINKTLDFTLGKMVGYEFDELIIWLLGDMVSGMIHDELIETADLMMVDQIFSGAEVVSSGFSELLKNYKKIKVIGVVGNHGRFFKKKRFKRITNNWDTVFYKTLELTFKNESRISFNLPQSFFSHDEVRGWKFLSMHGDNINSWMQIPFYGINRKEGEFAKLFGSKHDYFDYMFLGHFHTSSTLDTVRGEKIICGSFSGGDDYSLGKMTSVHLPKQLIFGIHDDYGISWRLPVMLP